MLLSNLKVNTNCGFQNWFSVLYVCLNFRNLLQFSSAFFAFSFELEHLFQVLTRVIVIFMCPTVIVVYFDFNVVFIIFLVQLFKFFSAECFLLELLFPNWVQDGGAPIFGPFPAALDPSKPYGKFQTDGVDCYISREQRTIFLDVQPVYSGSVLEEMIIGDRKPPAVSSEHVFVEHTVELQSIMFGAFLMSVCHKILVVMKGCVDERVLRFLRLATILKLGPVHKDALNEANLFDHWPALIFVNNLCNPCDLFWERRKTACEKLAILMKDYPLRYNADPERKSTPEDEHGIN